MWINRTRDLFLLIKCIFAINHHKDLKYFTWIFIFYWKWFALFFIVFFLNSFLIFIKPLLNIAQIFFKWSTNYTKFVIKKRVNTKSLKRLCYELWFIYPRKNKYRKTHIAIKLVAFLFCSEYIKKKIIEKK